MLRSDLNCWSFERECLFVSVWRPVQVERELIERFAEAHVRFASTVGRHSQLVVVDLGRGRRISRDARDLALQHTRDLAPQIAATAQVVLGSGFLAAAARTLMTGATVLQNQRTAVVRATVDEGLAWLVRQGELDEDVRVRVRAEVTAALEAMRRAALEETDRMEA